MPKGNKKPVYKIKFEKGKKITNMIRYEHWANLERIKRKIKGLKSDLDRDCKPYYKYDELCEVLSEQQEALEMEDQMEN